MVCELDGPIPILNNSAHAINKVSTVVELLLLCCCCVVENDKREYSVLKNNHKVVDHVQTA